jgi:hypothetical protein
MASFCLGWSFFVSSVVSVGFVMETQLASLWLDGAVLGAF